VLGIVGVDGSPSCGVECSLDVRGSFEGLARLGADATSREVNAVVRAAAVPGRGLFVALLQDELQRRRLSVPLLAYDLLAELEGRPSAVQLPHALP
jgi:hypothetical protein